MACAKRKLAMNRQRSGIWLVATAAMLAACTGTLGDPSGEGVNGDGAPLCVKGGTPGPYPRLVRLTHAQYDNTVSDLFGAPLTPSASFIKDPAFAGFTNNAAGLLTSDRLARDYRRAAEELAEYVSASPDILAQIIPCTPAGDGEACAREFVQSFGRRLYRRPIDQATEDAYIVLYHQGNGSYLTGTPFEQGIHLVIEGMLQSPKFLYRVELSEQLDSENLVPLDSYEIASRLSYLLWNNQPDEALLQAAESGALANAEGIAAEARRMLDDPKAAGSIDDFHEQWLHMKRYEDLSKDPVKYPGFDSSMAEDMKEETRRFIRHVIFELEGDYNALMTTPVTFVNDRLAGVYDLQGQFTSDFVQVDLDPAQRGGLLTQTGFLASHAYFDKTSPIHRGVFIQRQVLCATLPDPPGNIDTTLPPIEGEIKTTRDQVEVHTSPDACVGCHGIINPPGFAFEHFDAIGKYRADEDGAAIDTAASVLINGEQVPFDGATDLMAKLGDSAAAKSCYLTQWVRYGYARDTTEEDLCTIAELDEQLASSGYNIKDLLVALTQTKTFRFRAVEEVTP
jgi:hypothetical protein